MTTDIITPEEHALLRFPADVPGLLRRGSPVWMSWLPAGVKPVAICSPHRDSNGEHRVCVSDGGSSPLLSLVYLDLTDATGRAHLAWWLAATMYPECPPTDGAAVAWQLFPGQQPGCGWWLRYCARGANSASTTVAPTFSGHWSPRMWAQAVPALAALDPDDPRLLSDGSRLVDALALSLVARPIGPTFDQQVVLTTIYDYQRNGHDY